MNAASFLFVIAALAVIRPAKRAKSPRATTRMGAWQTLTAGLSYARQNRTVGVLILSVAMMTVFGMPYMMLLPAIADKALHGGNLVTGYLMTANGLGAVVGALVVASLPATVQPRAARPLLAPGDGTAALRASRCHAPLWLSLVVLRAGRARRS